MAEKQTLTISIRMSPELRDKLQALADKEERTLSQVCMRILRDHIKKLEPNADEAEGAPTKKPRKKS